MGGHRLWCLWLTRLILARALLAGNGSVAAQAMRDLSESQKTSR